MISPSSQTSRQTSQASSRAQTPLLEIQRKPFMYLARKFITKIPPVIKYGVPFAIGGFGLGQIYNSYSNKPVKSDNTTLKAEETISPKPSETPIPRSTFNPQHPRTGYRYHVPFD